MFKVQIDKQQLLSALLMVAGAVDKKAIYPYFV